LSSCKYGFYLVAVGGHDGRRVASCASDAVPDYAEMTQAADPRIGVVRVVLLVEASDSRAEPSTIGVCDGEGTRAALSDTY
jgi:hypothetical protein